MFALTSPRGRSTLLVRGGFRGESERIRAGSPANFPLPGLRDGWSTSCPIAVQRGPVSARGVQAPGCSRAERGSLKRATRVPPAIAQGTTEAAHTAKAGVLSRERRLKAVRSFRFARRSARLRGCPLRDRIHGDARRAEGRA